MSITTGPGFNRIWGMLIGFFGLFLAIYGLLNEIVLLYISLIPLIIGISLVVWDYIRVSEAQVDINWGDVFKNLITIFPDSDLVPVGIGKEFKFIKEGKFEEALVIINKALENDLYDPHLFYLRSYCKSHLGDPKSALRNIEKAISLDERNPEFIRLKAHYLFDLKNYTEAMSTISHAIQLDRNYSKAKMSQAYLLYRLEHYEKAREIILCVTRIEDEWELTIRGKILAQLNRDSEAVTTLENVIAINPSNLEAIVLVADIYSRQGQKERAESLYKKALLITKIYPEDWFAQGRALNALNKHEEALKSFNHALNKQPNNIQILREKEKTLLKLSFNQKAEKVHKDIEKLSELFSCN